MLWIILWHDPATQQVHCPATVLPRWAWCSLARRCGAYQKDTTDTEERYALCPCLAVTPSVRCL